MAILVGGQRRMNKHLSEPILEIQPNLLLEIHNTKLKRRSMKYEIVHYQAMSRPIFIQIKSHVHVKHEQRSFLNI